MIFLKRILPWRTKDRLRRGYIQFRHATRSKGSLPDFIIVGAQKSGTSSLHAYLSQHPQLLPSFTKEVHFFSGGLDPSIDLYEKGEGWYRAHFPLKKIAATRTRTFESTPRYLFDPRVPGRMFNLIPDVKIIALLRNPTERAISNYFHVKRQGAEHLPILEAMKEEEVRLEHLIEDKHYNGLASGRYAYKKRGLYKEQLERYLQYFPRNQILVICSENFFCNTHLTLQEIYRFVGVDAEFKPKDLIPRNVTRSKIDPGSEVYEYLNSYFRHPNQELYEFLGQDCGW